VPADHGGKGLCKKVNFEQSVGYVLKALLVMHSDIYTSLYVYSSPSFYLRVFMPLPLGRGH